MRLRMIVGAILLAGMARSAFGTPLAVFTLRDETTTILEFSAFAGGKFILREPTTGQTRELMEADVAAVDFLEKPVEWGTDRRFDAATADMLMRSALNNRQFALLALMLVAEGRRQPQGVRAFQAWIEESLKLPTLTPDRAMHLRLSEWMCSSALNEAEKTRALRQAFLRDYQGNAEWRRLLREMEAVREWRERPLIRPPVAREPRRAP